MTTRTVSGSTYTLGYDAENRLTSVTGAATASFVYDGDGNRVKSVVGTTTTYFVGSHYESSGGVVTKYYLAGGTRVAMRTGSASFYWLLSDHLGSTSKVATAAGALHSQQLYKAWGESRYTSGTLPTRYTYTGQYSYASDFGLLFYGSRFYDPLLSRWTSPDSIIPQNQGTLAWDRYSYVNNSPLNYTDPTGHMADHGCNTEGCSLSTRDKANENYDRKKQEQQLCQSGKSAYCSGVDTALQNADQWAWENIPSAIALSGGITGQMGIGLEPTVTPIEGSIVFNWRSGEVSTFTSGGAGMYIGTANILGGNLSVGLLGYYGVSQNQYLAGPSVQTIFTGSVDAFGKFGGYIGQGQAIQSGSEFPPQPFVDPISNISITSRHAGVILGINAGANVVDLGMTITGSFSEMKSNWYSR